MKITIITLFPAMIKGFFNESIIKRAQEKELVEIEIINLRDFAVDDYGSVDNRPYGGGAGMVLRADVVYAALNKLKVKSEKLKVKKIITSPKGKVYTQEKAIEFSKLDHLIIFAGHYEDIDARAIDYFDEEVSMGDFVMTGGEIVASAIVDSVVRLIPGVLKKENATENESFFQVPIDRLIQVVGEAEVLTKLKEKGIKEVKLLEYPQYTRPVEFEGKKVPIILTKGNHQEIEKWQLEQAFVETLLKRPDLLK